MSTPPLESHTDSPAERQAVLATAVGRPDEAAARGDCANTLASAQTLAIGEEPGDESSGQARRPASAG
jgi:hypothetical protein